MAATVMSCLAVLATCLCILEYLSYLLLEYILQIKNYDDPFGEGQLVGEMVAFSCIHHRNVMGFVMTPAKVKQVCGWLQ